MQHYPTLDDLYVLGRTVFSQQYEAAGLDEPIWQAQAKTMSAGSKEPFYSTRPDFYTPDAGLERFDYLDYASNPAVQKKLEILRALKPDLKLPDAEQSDLMHMIAHYGANAPHTPVGEVMTKIAEVAFYGMTSAEKYLAEVVRANFSPEDIERHNLNQVVFNLKMLSEITGEPNPPLHDRKSIIRYTAAVAGATYFDAAQNIDAVDRPDSPFYQPETLEYRRSELNLDPFENNARFNQTLLRPLMVYHNIKEGFGRDLQTATPEQIAQLPSKAFAVEENPELNKALNHYRTELGEGSSPSDLYVMQDDSFVSRILNKAIKDMEEINKPFSR